MQSKTALFTVTIHEGEKVHVLGVLSQDLLSAVQKVEKQFIHADPRETHGEIVRAERASHVHILD
jgi:hypothetical protein